MGVNSRLWLCVFVFILKVVSGGWASTPETIQHVAYARQCREYTARTISLSVGALKKLRVPLGRFYMERYCTGTSTESTATVTDTTETNQMILG
jgi:hypothetical protein